MSSSLLCPCTTGRSPHQQQQHQQPRSSQYQHQLANGIDRDSPQALAAAREVSRQIDRQIRLDKERRRQERRILLLGTAASGKSTFLRSLRIIHRDRFDEDELKSFKAVIYSNIWRGVMKLLFIKKQLGIKWQNSKQGVPAVKALLAIEKDIGLAKVMTYRIGEAEFLAAVPHIRVIWCDSGVRQAFERRHSVHGDEEFKDVGENLDYYLNQLDTIAVANYRPSEEHVLRSRRFTDSLFEKCLEYDGTPLRIIDIGGHTNERRKWGKTLRVFKGELQSVIYIIACSTFNETYTKPMTGEMINKLDESFECLRHLMDIKSELFSSDMNLIIFFNKDDLFTYKIKELGMDYSQFDCSFDKVHYDPTNVGHVREHLVRRLNTVLTANLQMKKYTHFTTSIDLDNVRRVFKDIKHTVMQNFLHEALPS